MPSGAVERYLLRSLLYPFPGGCKQRPKAFFLCIMYIAFFKAALQIGLSDSELLLYIRLSNLTNFGQNSVELTNKNLLELTGWSLGKLQQTKRLLKEKGILRTQQIQDEYTGQVFTYYIICNYSHLVHLMDNKNNEQL